MKTIIFQGWEPIKPVPLGAKLCMDSVELAAKELGFDYHLYGKGFFNHSFEFMKEDSWSVLARASYSRNYWAIKFFEQGYDRDIWVDSDVPVRDKSVFEVKNTLHATLEQQYYLDGDRLVRRPSDLVTNSVLNYSSIDQPKMFFQAQVEKARNIGKEEYIAKTSLGTDLYTCLCSYFGCDYFEGVYFATKDIREMLISGNTEVLKSQLMPKAINICGSLMSDKDFLTAFHNFMEL